jgi:uncharacterized membrane protein YbaN (DUF454 family)
MTMNDFNFAQWLTNLGAGVAVLGTILGWFPYFAAVVAVAWYCVQLYESKTFQHWLHTRRTRKIAAYQKEIERLEAQNKIARSKRGGETDG